MLITQRYSEQIAGVISCYDRVVIQGTLPGWCFDGGMTAFLYTKKIKIFDYPQFANALREELRSHVESIARENDLEIEFIRKIDAFRKDDRIKEILGERGMRPGLVHIFSAMESCTSYMPWHDKKTGKTSLKFIPVIIGEFNAIAGAHYIYVPFMCLSKSLLPGLIFLDLLKVHTQNSISPNCT